MTKRKAKREEKGPGFSHPKVHSKQSIPSRTNLDILSAVLEALLSQRRQAQANRWDDNEVEDLDTNFNFKNAEALHAMLFPAGFLDGFDNPVLDDLIRFDLNNLLENCLEDGDIKLNFSPGIFLSPETEDSLVDFAALSIRLFLLAKKLNHGESETKKKIDKLISQTTKTLLENAIRRPVGIGWGATLYPNKSKKDIKPDSFFTSCTIIALFDAYSSHFSPLTSQEKTGVRDVIIKSTYWLEQRFDGNLVASDEEGPSSIVHLLYALRAFLTSWNLLDQDRQGTCIKMAKAYLKWLGDQPVIRAPKIYHTVSVSDSKKAAAYEDRSAFGSILTVLSLMRNKLGNDTSIDPEELAKRIADVYSSILKDRGDVTGLWPGNQFTIYHTYQAIEGLVNYALYAQARLISLSEIEIVKAVTDTLNSKVVHDLIIANLIRTSEARAAKKLTQGD